MKDRISFPSWLQLDTVNDRLASLAAFRKNARLALHQFGLPSRKDERFKHAHLDFLYQQHFKSSVLSQENDSRLTEMIQEKRIKSDQSILLTVIDGIFSQALSDCTHLPKEAVICELSEAYERYPDLINAHFNRIIDAKRYPFANLNAALFSDGLFFYLPDHCRIDIPIHLLFISDTNENITQHPHHLFILGENSKAILVEEHITSPSSLSLMNIVSSINVGKSAELVRYKIQTIVNRASHVATTFIDQAEDSQVLFFNIAIGSLFSRDDIIAQLQSSRARCEFIGFYHLNRDDQYIDHHLDINHHATHCHSEMFYKGIVDKKSCAVFNGKLSVQSGANKTSAHQTNHHLLLSQKAESYAQPELEIYADDVKCKHGATTGELDQDMLFYMQSRGINQEDARAILLKGFLEEVMKRMVHPDIKCHIEMQLS